jgi:hypothetical protein
MNAHRGVPIFPEEGRPGSFFERRSLSAVAAPQDVARHPGKIFRCTAGSAAGETDNARGARPAEGAAPGSVAKVRSREEPKQTKKRDDLDTVRDTQLKNSNMVISY